MMILYDMAINLLNYFVSVNRPPNIYAQPVKRDIYYKPGESVEILCIADGIPKPK